MTGSFDDWQKTVTLEKKDGVFTKTVELPKVHTQYKVRTQPASSLPKLAPSLEANLLARTMLMRL